MDDQNPSIVALELFDRYAVAKSLAQPGFRTPRLRKCLRAHDGAGALIRDPEQKLAAAFVGQSHTVSKQFLEMVVVPRFLELEACTFGRIRPLPKLLP